MILKKLEIVSPARGFLVFSATPAEITGTAILNPGLKNNAHFFSPLKKTFPLFFYTALLLTETDYG